MQIFPGANAIWGGTGRDSRGHIWIGVCESGGTSPSAHLLEFEPETSKLHDRGDVISQLQLAGEYRDGESQMKIHSKIVQAQDGQLYFASMDEQGENPDGSQLPKWGSHLWSLDTYSGRWKHLFHAPEALIAVATSGTKVYTLGYFNHVLYQYDCKTHQTKSVHVGSLGGHISRNFLVDERGHAYVPRLREHPSAPSGMLTTLVELDASLHEVAETALQHYSQTKDDQSHGIVGVQPMADHSLVFATDQGFLYRIAPNENVPAEVEEIGWFSPDGSSYVGSLFTYDGGRWLLGATQRNSPAGRRCEWLIFDRIALNSTSVPMLGTAVSPAAALYGSYTRDDQGDMYLVGTQDGVPLLYRVHLPP